MENTQLAHNIGTPTARQQFAILMAYRWRAVGGPKCLLSGLNDLEIACKMPLPFFEHISKPF